MWIAGTLLMWFASILLVGSFIKNPAFPGAPGPKGGPAGVFKITRHPMMGSFAIWAIVHLGVVAMPKALVLDGAILMSRRHIDGYAFEAPSRQAPFFDVATVRDPLRPKT